MKKSIVLCILLPVLLLSACNQQTSNNGSGDKSSKSSTSKEGTAGSFDQHGVAFSYPASEWEITENEFDEDVLNVTLEKKGDEASGIVCILVGSDDIEPNDLLEVMAEAFLEEKDAYTDMTFENVQKANMEKYSGLVLSYKAKVYAQQFEGKIYAFTTNNKTVGLLIQGATSDKEANTPGFDEIMKSFSVK
jgi:hypothetical protein